MLIQRLKGAVVAAAFALSLTFTAYVLSAIPNLQPARAQFAGVQTWGGQSTGTVNAQVIAISNIGSTNDLTGLVFTFIAQTNTGAATLTINSNGNNFGPFPILRPTSIGYQPLSGNELAAGEISAVIWVPASSSFVITGQPLTVISQAVEFRGAIAPRGTLIEDGSCVSQTTYAALFSVIGTNFGTCSAGLFALPDSRGTMLLALDNQGANGAANRVTSAGSGCTATALTGTVCGSQNQTLTQAQLPVFTPSGSVSTSVSVGGTVSTTLTLAATAPVQGAYPGTTLANVAAIGTNSTTLSSIPITFTSASASSSFSGFGSASSSFAGNSIGSGNAHPLLNPASLVRRAIRY